MQGSEKIIAGAVAGVVGVGFVSSMQSGDKGSPVQSNATDSMEIRAAEGIINLPEVKDAFRTTQEMTVFEQRVNEIYEGEKMVVFEARELRNGFMIKASEDLDGSKSASSSDDLLFTLSIKGREATLKGNGANSYYKETWLYELPEGAANQMTQSSHRSSFTSSPFFWWWMMSPGWGGYYTPVSRYDSMYFHRNSYRHSSAYQSQMARNTSFARGRSSSFRNTSSSMSSQRKSYVKKMPSTSGYKQKVAASTRNKSARVSSQRRSSSQSRNSFSGSSRSSRSSRSFGGFSGSSGF